jgi:hypothetical protein
MKKIFLALVLLLAPFLANAAYFPNDAITLLFTDPADNSLILASSSQIRTILKAGSNCSNTTYGIFLEKGTSGTYVLNRQAGGDKMTNNDMNYSLPAYTPIYFRENGASNCFITFVYTPRDRSTTFDPFTATTSAVIASSSISSLYTGANFYEWLFMGCVILLLLSLLVWRLVFSPITKTYAS